MVVLFENQTLPLCQRCKSQGVQCKDHMCVRETLLVSFQLRGHKAHTQRPITKTHSTCHPPPPHLVIRAACSVHCGALRNRGPPGCWTLMSQLVVQLTPTGHGAICVADHPVM